MLVSDNEFNWQSYDPHKIWFESKKLIVTGYPGEGTRVAEVFHCWNLWRRKKEASTHFKTEQAFPWGVFSTWRSEQLIQQIFIYSLEKVLQWDISYTISSSFLITNMSGIIH